MPHPGLASQRRLSVRSARQVCASYSLGEIVRFAPVAAGTLNLNYLVETSRGRYFLKHYVGMRRADLQQQHRLLGALQAAGLSVAAPVADQHGQTFMTISQRPLAVFPWIDGEHRPHSVVSDDDCHAIGALLGRTHLALAEAGADAQQTFMLPPIRVERTLARVSQLRQLVQAHQVLLPGDPFDDVADACLDFTLDQLRQRARKEIGSQPCVTAWQWTHGDFHAGNVFFQPDGTLTLIDWDKARVQPRLFELIRAIVLWLADAQTGELDVHLAWSMMRGYAAWVPVEPRVLPQIVDYFWWSKLNDLWILDRHYVQADPIADGLLQPTLGFLRWLLDRRQILAEALEDAAHVDSSPPRVPQ